MYFFIYVIPYYNGQANSCKIHSEPLGCKVTPHIHLRDFSLLNRVNIDAYCVFLIWWTKYLWSITFHVLHWRYTILCWWNILNRVFCVNVCFIKLVTKIMCTMAPLSPAGKYILTVYSKQNYMSDERNARNKCRDHCVKYFSTKNNKI